MTPVKHNFVNRVLTAPRGKEDEILTLEVYTDEEQCISCWKMNWKERLSALFFGRMWLSVMSGGTQPPVWLMVTRRALEERK